MAAAGGPSKREGWRVVGKGVYAGLRGKADLHGQLTTVRQSAMQTESENLLVQRADVIDFA